jgi:hypothetical protein
VHGLGAHECGHLHLGELDAAHVLGHPTVSACHLAHEEHRDSVEKNAQRVPIHPS